MPAQAVIFANVLSGRSRPSRARPRLGPDRRIPGSGRTAAAGGVRTTPGGPGRVSAALASHRRPTSPLSRVPKPSRCEPNFKGERERGLPDARAGPERRGVQAGVQPSRHESPHGTETGGRPGTGRPIVRASETDAPGRVPGGAARRRWGHWRMPRRATGSQCIRRANDARHTPSGPCPPLSGR